MKTKLPLFGWALYDFANTIFSAVVLTFYFPLYLTSLSQRNVHLGVATTSAMVLAGVVVPWLGALSDRTGKTKTYLVVTTLLCIVFTMLLSFFTFLPFLVGSFLLACFFFHASLVFYFALLPVVAKPPRQGFASGFGTALGYFGVLVAIPIAYEVDAFFGRRFVFWVAGVLFFIFSLPLFFWVPERKVENPFPPSLRLFKDQWVGVFRTLGKLRREPPLLFFFLGNFFVMEAMNTVIFWMILYLAHVFHLPQFYLVATFLALNLSAFLFGFLAGFLTDSWGAEKTLLAAVGAFFLTLFGLALSSSYEIFLVLSLTGGAFGLAGNWTAARKRVLELVPNEEVGEYFGLYNLTTKISVTSSLIFSILADRFGFRVALLSQLLPSGLGLMFLCLAEFNRRSASRYPSS